MTAGRRLERSLRLLVGLNRARAHLGHSSPNAQVWERKLEEHDAAIGYSRGRTTDDGRIYQPGEEAKTASQGEWRRRG